MDNIERNKYTKDEIVTLLGEDLKSHYQKRDSVGIVSVGGEVVDFKDSNIDEEQETYKSLDKFKIKLVTKVVGALAVVASIFVYDYLPENIKQNNIFTWVKSEYNKSYSKVEVIENVEEYSKKVYSKIQRVIPEKMYSALVENYINKVKPKIVDFNISNLIENKNIDNTVAVFNEDDIVINRDEFTLAEEVVTTSSEISLMDMDREEIAKKNISITLPVKGTVTSDYGAREEVFENVGYHTGVDIANVLNTPVASATDGKVVSAEPMHKYYGNNIEIEKDGVIFKYAHLNQINVKEGDIVSQGDIIGLMGSTGASTGSHLHFEIKINGRTVDPELLLKIR